MLIRVQTVTKEELLSNLKIDNNLLTVLKNELSYYPDDKIYIEFDVIDKNDFDDDVAYWADFIQNNPIYNATKPFMSIEHDSGRLCEYNDDIIITHNVYLIDPINRIIIWFRTHDESYSYGTLIHLVCEKDVSDGFIKKLKLKPVE